jgi:hypothetical protein
MARTRGLSPKIIAPVAAALAAFAQAKIHDQATAALVVSLIGAAGLYLAPPGVVEAKDVPTADEKAARARGPMTMAPAGTPASAAYSSSWTTTTTTTTPVSADTDGDTMLEPELADREHDTPPVPDEVDSPNQTQRSLS